jgi:hypothetical protein
MSDVRSILPKNRISRFRSFRSWKSCVFDITDCNGEAHEVGLAMLCGKSPQIAGSEIIVRTCKILSLAGLGKLSSVDVSLGDMGLGGRELEVIIVWFCESKQTCEFVFNFSRLWQELKGGCWSGLVRSVFGAGEDEDDWARDWFVVPHSGRQSREWVGGLNFWKGKDVRKLMLW